MCRQGRLWMVVALAGLLLASGCDPATTSSSSPIIAVSSSAAGPVQPPGPKITSLAWYGRWCFGGWGCQASLQVSEGVVSLSAEVARGVDSASHAIGRSSPVTTGVLTERGARALAAWANAILRSNPRIYSGGCGAPCDGLSFLVDVVNGSNRWTLIWGAERRASVMHKAIDRAQALVANLARCRDDPWVRVDTPCSPIPK